jgi:hypothetical protein
MPSDLARATPPATKDHQRHPRLPSSDPYAHRLFNVRNSFLSSICPGGGEVPMSDFPATPPCALCCMATGTEPRRNAATSSPTTRCLPLVPHAECLGMAHSVGVVLCARRSPDCQPVPRIYPTRNRGLDSLDQVRIMAQTRHRRCRLLAYGAGTDFIPADPERSKPDCYQESAEWSSSANVVAHP